VSASELFDALLRLFNDLIAAVIPGLLLMLGLALLHTESTVTSITQRLPSAEWGAGIVLAVSYASGHLLLSLASFVEARWKSIRQYLTAKRIPAISLARAETKSSVAYFARHVELQIRAQRTLRNHSSEDPADPLPFNEMRNIAMTVSPEGAALGYRFISISLLCTGVATALCVVVADSVVGMCFYPSSLAISTFKELATLIGIVLAAAALLFVRASEFRRRALETPFSVALAQVLFPRRENEERKK
jgi:hypothetical protein